MFGEFLIAILVSRGLSRKQHCAVEAGKPLRFRYLSKLQARFESRQSQQVLPKRIDLYREQCMERHVTAYEPDRSIYLEREPS